MSGTRKGTGWRDDRVWQIVNVTDEKDAPELAANAHVQALDSLRD